MVAIVRRATDSTATETEWMPCPEGLRRFVVGEPAVEVSGFKDDAGNDKYRVVFPLRLTEAEYERAKGEVELEDGQTLSGRVRYRVGLSFGFMRRGEYVSTKLVDFLCALVGHKNRKRLYTYFEHGGGPAVDGQAPVEDQIATINQWLKWFEEAEVYGTVSHSQGKTEPNRTFANFGGPIAVGSLPGQTEAEYQAWGLGRVKALEADIETSPAAVGISEGDAVAQQAAGMPADQANEPTPAQAAQQRTYQDVFGADDE